MSHSRKMLKENNASIMAVDMPSIIKQVDHQQQVGSAMKNMNNQSIVNEPPSQNTFKLRLINQTSETFDQRNAQKKVFA